MVAKNTNMQELTPKSFLVRGMDPVLHKRFKVQCAKEGVSMQEKLTQLIQDHLKGK